MTMRAKFRDPDALVNRLTRRGRSVRSPSGRKDGILESGRGDLNPRPPAPKAGALPGCATPRVFPALTCVFADQARTPPPSQALGPRRNQDDSTEDHNMNSVGHLERVGRSFERHPWAENKSPKTVTSTPIILVLQGTSPCWLPYLSSTPDKLGTVKSKVRCCPGLAGRFVEPVQCCEGSAGSTPRTAQFLLYFRNSDGRIHWIGFGKVAMNSVDCSLVIPYSTPPMSHEMPLRGAFLASCAARRLTHRLACIGSAVGRRWVLHGQGESACRP